MVRGWQTFASHCLHALLVVSGAAVDAPLAPLPPPRQACAALVFLAQPSKRAVSYANCTSSGHTINP